MSCSTPTRPLDTSSQQLLRRLNMCTERSFIQTPSRNGRTKRKVVPELSSTLGLDVTLLNETDLTIIGNSTAIDDTMFSIDKTLTDQLTQSVLEETIVTAPWEVISSIREQPSDFSILTNSTQSNVSQMTVISKKSSKGNSGRTSSFFSRFLKPSTPKPQSNNGNGVKFVNRCVRDIDRLNDTFGKEWITLPNFV